MTQATADPTTHIAYRADIDGLRALAVVPVVMFHAGVRGFSGGFVGVDIFFVISGYLITGILLREQALGRLSIAEFYRRRILRIFPALMAMALATSVGAALWLMPGEWERYARSLGGAALFTSNIVFYLAIDYFHTGGLSEPLLHTWSLAVEEQWYLVWPLLIAAVGPRRPRLMLGLMSAIVLASLVYCAWVLPRDPSAAFYLLPSRAWELGLGAWLAVAALRAPGQRMAELLSLIGLALIAYAVKIYTDAIAFPGLAAVPPCLGATLLIHAGRANNRVGRLLGCAPLRGIGLISYSLYLWHWPIIVFAENGLFIGHSMGAVAATLVVIAVISWLSWRCIERPFRTGAVRWPTPRVLVAGGGAIAAIVALAVGLPGLADAVNRFSPRERAIASTLAYDGDGAYRRGSCFRVTWQNRYDPRCLATTGRPAVLFIGDSHAAQLWPGLSRVRDRYDVLQATTTGCLAKLPPGPVKPDSCDAVIAAGFDWLKTHRPAGLILASRWRLSLMDGLEATLRDPIVRRSHPLLVGPIPQYETQLPRLIIAAERRQDPDLLRRNQLDEPFVLDRQMRSLAARTGTPYLSLVDLLCDAQHRCGTLAAPDVPLQFDYGHLTAAGSALVSDAVLSALARAYPASMSTASR